MRLVQCYWLTAYTAQGHGLERCLADTVVRPANMMPAAANAPSCRARSSPDSSGQKKSLQALFVLQTLLISLMRDLVLTFYAYNTTHA